MGFNDWMRGKMDKIDHWDVGLIKVSVFFLAWWLAAQFTPMMDWLHNVNPWVWFGIFIVAAIRPFYKAHIKK